MGCNTIKIKATTGSYPFSVINEEDFDAARHTLYIEAAQAEAAAWGDTKTETPAEAAPAAKRGRK